MNDHIPKQFTFPIKWDFGDTKSRYATNMLIQESENEFFVSFFEIAPPLIFSPDDEGNIESVKAECVSRIVVAKDKLQSFVDALQQAINKASDSNIEEGE